MADYDTFNGWLESPQTVEVRARVRGHIQKVHFTDGQLVKKGDVLFELDSAVQQRGVSPDQPLAVRDGCVHMTTTSLSFELGVFRDSRDEFVERMVGAGLVALGAVELLLVGSLGGIWLALIGWFLATAVSGAGAASGGLSSDRKETEAGT